MAQRKSKRDRQNDLMRYIEENPFITDQELAHIYGVSVQTIRLDRMELKIPDARSRIKNVAKNTYDQIKSLTWPEIIGDLVDLDLNKTALSIMTPTEDMALKKSGIVRGHHIFALANSLAVAVVDADVALTGSAGIKFIRPVHVGDRVIAKATVREIDGKKFIVDVTVKVDAEEVCEGEFVIIAVSRS